MKRTSFSIRITPAISIVMLLFVAGEAAKSQQPDLSRMLDAVDSSSGWSRTPVSDAQRSQPAFADPQAANPTSQQFMRRNQGAMPNPTRVVQQGSYPTPMWTENQAARMQQIQRQQAAIPNVSRQIMKSFFNGNFAGAMGGGSAPSPTPPPQKSYGSSTAYSDWQRAENEAIRARNYGRTARYDKDKWARKNAADRAYYASNAARAASDRVYYASLNGDPTAKQYASKARDAADRAKADADRARYNADTIR